MSLPIHRFAASAATALAGTAAFAAVTGAVSRDYTAAPQEVVANDNRIPAGNLSGGTLTIHLHVTMARWHPEAPDGPFADVAALAEDGKAPTIPGPLIRVRMGTTVVATVRNDLTDSTIWVRGLATHPSPPDSVPIAPGATHTFSFVAGQPGTYVYGAKPGHFDVNVHEREQMSSAFIVDPIGGRTDDRVFVINIWGEPVDSTSYRNALAINGKSWPFTERISANVGDTLRWRVINGSARVHPMHLHGFYFRVDSRGTPYADTIFAADRRRVAVTEDMDAGSTMAMVFSPDRPGNWLFHCHLTFHVNSDARLDGTGGEHAHESDPMKHMSGLVLGFKVNQASGIDAARPREAEVRKLRLFADERPRKGRTPLQMSYVLQRGSQTPAPDSVEPAGAAIVLRRNQPTRFTIINRAHEGTSVHWHGVELLSYADGVAGWSGMSNTLAPMIAPNDSFVANLRLPRAGTFIYHTHLNDIEQITSGMYGALLVLPERERYDPTTDHSFVMGWDGTDGAPNILVNGDSLPKPLEMKYGKSHRLRFINIGPADRIFFAVRQDTATLRWKPRAKDGADLPKQLHVPGPSIVRLNVGETFDADFNPPAPGEYRLTVGRPKTPMSWSQRIIVR